MLAITFLIIAVFIFALRDTVLENYRTWSIITIVLFIPIMAIVIAITCCGAGRKYPANIILLVICAVLYGLVFGILSVTYSGIQALCTLSLLHSLSSLPILYVTPSPSYLPSPPLPPQSNRF